MANAPDPLRITTTEHTIHLAGELDAATAPHLRATLAHATIAEDGALVLDLSQLEFCDSTGLTVLVHTQNQLPTPGRLILHGATDQLRRLLRVTHLDDAFTLT